VQQMQRNNKRPASIFDIKEDAFSEALVRIPSVWALM